MTELHSEENPALLPPTPQTDVESDPIALEPSTPHPEAPAPDSSSEASAVPAADVRARLMSQFEQWLDRMLAGEPPPEGLPEEMLAEMESATGRDAPRGAEADLYTLFSALTTLSGEIRLQGRAFKQLTDAIAPLSALPRGIEQLYALQQDSADRMDQLLDQMQPSEVETAESSLPPPKQMLAVLMDLYDRMHRGRRTLQAATETLATRAPRGLRRWLGGSDLSDAARSLTGILDGYSLTLTRIEDMLREWDVERIGFSGEPFDPERMTAVEIAPANGILDGTVLDVYRTGYAVRGAVLATAQVKVARDNGK